MRKRGFARLLLYAGFYQLPKRHHQGKMTAHALFGKLNTLIREDPDCGIEHFRHVRWASTQVRSHKVITEPMSQPHRAKGPDGVGVRGGVAGEMAEAGEAIAHGNAERLYNIPPVTD
jgi:hypothetical protein